MNMWQELERLTAPEFAASPIRVLSREEIEALESTGAVTPPEQIPHLHFQFRVSFPEDRFRGKYARFYRRRVV